MGDSATALVGHRWAGNGDRDLRRSCRRSRIVSEAGVWLRVSMTNRAAACFETPV